MKREQGVALNVNIKPKREEKIYEKLKSKREIVIYVRMSEVEST